MNYRRRMKVGGFVGLLAGGFLGAALSHDNIHGAMLLFWPGGLIAGLLLAHWSAMRKLQRMQGPSPTPSDYYRASRKP